MTEPWSPLFWSLDIEYWNLFVIWILKFGALKLGAWNLEFHQLMPAQYKTLQSQ